MNAELYITPLSFYYQEEITIHELEHELDDFLDLISFIRDSNEIYPDPDVIFLCTDVYYHKIIDDLSFFDLIYTKESNIFSPELKALLRLHFTKSKTIDLTTSDLNTLLNNDEECSLKGLLCSTKSLKDNSKATEHENLLIRNSQEWYKFHRTFLECNYINEVHFFNELSKYYTNIFFHLNVESSLKTLDGGLSLFAKRISENLAYLNDCFDLIYKKENLKETLSIFSK
jgi:hypothetical protein